MGIYFLAVIYLWFLCGYFYVVLLLFRDPRFREAVAMHPFVLFFINMAIPAFIVSIRFFSASSKLNPQKCSFANNL